MDALDVTGTLIIRGERGRSGKGKDECGQISFPLLKFANDEREHEAQMKTCQAKEKAFSNRPERRGEEEAQDSKMGMEEANKRRCVKTRSGNNLPKRRALGYNNSSSHTKRKRERARTSVRKTEVAGAARAERHLGTTGGQTKSSGRKKISAQKAATTAAAATTSELLTAAR